MQDQFDNDVIINQINSLFESLEFTGEDRDVIITIKARASQIVLEEVSKPIYPDFPDQILDGCYPLHLERRYYRISLRNPTPPADSPVMEVKYPRQFSYYRLDVGSNSTYYKKTEGREKMHFFMPTTATWVESVYSDDDLYANKADHGRLHEVSFTDLPDSIQTLEGDCE